MQQPGTNPQLPIGGVSPAASAKSQNSMQKMDFKHGGGSVSFDTDRNVFVGELNDGRVIYFHARGEQQLTEKYIKQMVDTNQIAGCLNYFAEHGHLVSALMDSSARIDKSAPFEKNASYALHAEDDRSAVLVNTNKNNTIYSRVTANENGKYPNIDQRIKEAFNASIPQSKQTAANANSVHQGTSQITQDALAQHQHLHQQTVSHQDDFSFDREGPATPTAHNSASGSANAPNNSASDWVRAEHPLSSQAPASSNQMDTKYGAAYNTTNAPAAVPRALTKEEDEKKELDELIEEMNTPSPLSQSQIADQEKVNQEKMKKAQDLKQAFQNLGGPKSAREYANPQPASAAAPPAASAGVQPPYPPLEPLPTILPQLPPVKSSAAAASVPLSVIASQSQVDNAQLQKQIIDFEEKYKIISEKFTKHNELINNIVSSMQTQQSSELVPELAKLVEDNEDLIKNYQDLTQQHEQLKKSGYSNQHISNDLSHKNGMLSHDPAVQILLRAFDRMDHPITPDVIISPDLFISNLRKLTIKDSELNFNATRNALIKMIRKTKTSMPAPAAQSPSQPSVMSTSQPAPLHVAENDQPAIVPSTPQSISSSPKASQPASSQVNENLSQPEIAPSQTSAPKMPPPTEAMYRQMMSEISEFAFENTMQDIRRNNDPDSVIAPPIGNMPENIEKLQAAISKKLTTENNVQTQRALNNTQARLEAVKNGEPLRLAANIARNYTPKDADDIQSKIKDLRFLEASIQAKYTGTDKSTLLKEINENIAIFEKKLTAQKPAVAATATNKPLQSPAKAEDKAGVRLDDLIAQKNAILKEKADILNNPTSSVPLRALREAQIELFNIELASLTKQIINLQSKVPSALANRPLEAQAKPASKPVSTPISSKKTVPASPENSAIANQIKVKNDEIAVLRENIRLSSTQNPKSQLGEKMSEDIKKLRGEIQALKNDIINLERQQKGLPPLLPKIGSGHTSPLSATPQADASTPGATSAGTPTPSTPSAPATPTLTSAPPSTPKPVAAPEPKIQQPAEPKIDSEMLKSANSLLTPKQTKKGGDQDKIIDQLHSSTPATPGKKIDPDLSRRVIQKGMMIAIATNGNTVGQDITLGSTERILRNAMNHPKLGEHLKKDAEFMRLVPEFNKLVAQREIDITPPSRTPPKPSVAVETPATHTPAQPKEKFSYESDISKFNKKLSSSMDGALARAQQEVDDANKKGVSGNALNKLQANLKTLQDLQSSAKPASNILDIARNLSNSSAQLGESAKQEFVQNLNEYINAQLKLTPREMDLSGADMQALIDLKDALAKEQAPEPEVLAVKAEPAAPAAAPISTPPQAPQQPVNLSPGEAFPAAPVRNTFVKPEPLPASFFSTPSGPTPAEPPLAEAVVTPAAAEPTVVLTLQQTLGLVKPKLKEFLNANIAQLTENLPTDSSTVEHRRVSNEITQYNNLLKAIDEGDNSEEAIHSIFSMIPDLIEQKLLSQDEIASLQQSLKEYFEPLLNKSSDDLTEFEKAQIKNYQAIIEAQG